MKESEHNDTNAEENKFHPHLFLEVAGALICLRELARSVTIFRMLLVI